MTSLSKHNILIISSSTYNFPDAHLSLRESSTIFVQFSLNFQGLLVTTEKLLNYIRKCSSDLFWDEIYLSVSFTYSPSQCKWVSILVLSHSFGNHYERKMTLSFPMGWPVVVWYAFKLGLSLSFLCPCFSLIFHPHFSFDRDAQLASGCSENGCFYNNESRAVASWTIAAVAGTDLTLDATTVLTSGSTDTAATTVSSGCLHWESIRWDSKQKNHQLLASRRSILIHESCQCICRADFLCCFFYV